MHNDKKVENVHFMLFFDDNSRSTVHHPYKPLPFDLFLFFWANLIIVCYEEPLLFIRE